MKILARRAKGRTTEADRPEPGEESRADRTVPVDFAAVLEAGDELDGVRV